MTITPLISKRPASSPNRWQAGWLTGLLSLMAWMLCWPLSSAQAAEYISYPNYSQVRLVSSSSQLSAESETLVGLHLRLDPEWHTYWRNPGDSGAAPMLELSFDSEQVEVGEIQWPLPERIDTPPLTTFGYENEVLLYVSLQLKPGAPAELTELELTLNAEWLACKQECIPAFDTFSQRFEVVSGPPTTGPDQALFESYAQQLPPAAEQTASYHVQPDQTDQVQVKLTGLPTGAQVLDFFPFDSPFLNNHEPLNITDKHMTLKLEQPLPEPAPVLQGLVFLRGQGLPAALQISATQQQGTPALGTTSSPDQTPLWQFMLMALVGGMILNIMPCVFPIIAIKLMSLLKQAQDRPALVRISSLAYIAGVLVTFEAFALLLLLLRASGQALGWGFQLQSPGFLVALILLFFVLSLNFLGLYEFRLPLLQPGRSEGSLWGQFATGALSVFVASPCTAPFMGAAMGFALSQSVGVILLIFLALGLGFALPYLLLLVSPKIVKYLPKPGNWMILFKEFMFFPMLLTALWLLWILGRISGLDAALAVLVGLVLLSIPFWLKQRLAARHKLLLLTWLLCLPLGLGAALWPLFQATSVASENSESSSEASDFWQPFSPVLLASERPERAVFINFTAAWCITCQVNEQVTFRDAAVRAQVADSKTLMLKADWTRRDPEITRVLTEHGRISVPFYLLYLPGETEPKILPELLTPAIFSKELSSNQKESNL